MSSQLIKESVNSVASVTSAVLPTMSGAIDIVVVRQQDGTFRSSPFYGATLNSNCVHREEFPKRL
eukprot:7217241-Pyramimonas_sp.AAC.2